ncbi:MAG: ABC transporter permease [Chloroflexi bacterium]|nr:ABC transporter permease [Chloroflexota bacterium]
MARELKSEMTAVPTRPWQAFAGDLGRQVVVQGGPFLILVLLGVSLAIASPHFLTFNNLSNVTRQSAITAILAVGQTLVIISGGIDLSVAAVMALSGSVGAVAMTYWGHDVVVGVILALLVGTFSGFVNGVIITKGRIPDFIATLGMMSIARGVGLLLTGGLPVPSHLTATALKAYLPAEIVWLGSGDIGGFPVIGLLAVGAGIVGWAVLNHTALGRSAFAVGGNREAARVSGINVDGNKIAIYTFMGFMAAIAGIVMTGRLNSANALMGDGLELQSIASVVIGGTNLYGGEGGIVGTLIGALVMGMIANGLDLVNVEAFWQRVMIGLVIVAVVVFDQWRRRRFGT